MENIDLQEILQRLSEKKEWASLCQVLTEMNPPDAAKALECLPVDKLSELFWRLNKDCAADIFSYLDPSLVVSIVQYFLTPRQPHSEQNAGGHLSDDAADKLGDILNEMPADDAADMVDDLQDELPAELVEAILREVDKDRRSEINAILKYPDNSAGSIMTLEYIMLYEDLTASQALDLIRHRGGDKETIYNCYAVGRARKLEGVVSLRDIILSKPDARIRDIMTSPVIYAQTHDDQEQVAARFKEYDLIAMPVCDKERRIVGIITIDDVVDVIEEENTEDFEKMAALHPSEDEYLKTSVVTLAKNRIIWLLVLLASAVLTSSIISNFKGLEKCMILASFMPMLMNTGGNCGGQVSTLIVRGLAVGELTLGDWFAIAWKEIRVGMLIGVTLALLNFCGMWFFLSDAQEHKVRVILVVSVTLFVMVCISKLLGAMLPLVAKKVHVDPALVANPLLLTMLDVTTLMVYFWIAHLILGV